MKCPKCGADSSVRGTRTFQTVLLRRERRCFNEHSFSTFEVHAGNLDRRTLLRTARGIADRADSERLKRSILAQPTASGVGVALELGCSESYVRHVRSRN